MWEVHSGKPCAPNGVCLITLGRLLTHTKHTAGLKLDHSPGFLRLVENAKRDVREVSVDDALRRMRDARATLVDVREESEWEAGHARGAIHLSKGLIERDIETTIPATGSEIILYCGGGFRSVLATRSLQEMGYTNVWSLAGGWRAWESGGAPVEREDEPLIAPPPV